MITEKLVQDVFAPRPGEQVTLLTDNAPRQREVIDAFGAAFQRLGFSPRLVIYPPTGGNSAPLPEAATVDGKTINLTGLLDALGKKDIVIAASSTSSSGPMFSRLKQGFRVATMPGATLDMSAFGADYRKVRTRSHLLRDKLNATNRAIVSFSTGHRLSFDLRVHRAKADDGDCTRPGCGINLPSGEAFIVPYEGRGSRTAGEWPIAGKEGVTVFRVERNTIVKVEGAKADFFSRTFQQHPAQRNIAELGLGCNEKAAMIGTILQDEKVEGMHIAYGMSSHLGGTVTPEMFLPGSSVHEDFVYAKGGPITVESLVLEIDGKEEMVLRNGRFTAFGQRRCGKGVGQGLTRKKRKH
ncbi:MAG: hypothetical protein V1735_01465 [Nanoarchaeota archaeon]